MMIDYSMLDLATMSAVVAALVTVVGNAFNIEKKYRALLAIVFAGILIFVPEGWGNQLITALVIGLTASGVYSQVKPREYKDALSNIDKSNKNQNKNDKTPY